MADYIGREVARERLRKACKAGTVFSVFVLIAGLAYAGMAGLIGMDVRVPDLVYNILVVLVPTIDDMVLATAECGTRALLLILAGIFGLLMFGKISKTSDAFRTGQLKQLRFLSVLVILLGFLPTLVGNGIKIYLAMRAGKAPTAVMSFAIDVLCIFVGLFMFVASRVLVAGSVYESQNQKMASDPYEGSRTEPNFSNVPDISTMTTAVPATQTTSVQQAAPADGLTVPMASEIGQSSAQEDAPKE